MFGRWKYNTLRVDGFLYVFPEHFCNELMLLSQNNPPDTELHLLRMFGRSVGVKVLRVIVSEITLTAVLE